MKAMLVFLYEKDGQVVTKNATVTFGDNVPTIQELSLIKRNLRENCGYENVVILNWFELKEE